MIPPGGITGVIRNDEIYIFKPRSDGTTCQICFDHSVNYVGTPLYFHPFESIPREVQPRFNPKFQKQWFHDFLLDIYRAPLYSVPLVLEQHSCPPNARPRHPTIERGLKMKLWKQNRSKPN